MGKFPRNFGPAGRQPEEFEMTSEMLEKLTNNMKWTLWPTTTEDGDTSSPANTSTSSNKENDNVVAGYPNEEVGAEVIVNDVSSLLSNLKLKAGICAMTDVVDATPGTNSLLMEPGLKNQNHHHKHHVQKMKKENKPIKYSREFLLMIRNEMKKQNKPFSGTIECPVVIRGNNDERFNTVTIPRRGQNIRQPPQQKYNPGFGENVPDFRIGVPTALHDHHYSSMNGNGNVNRSRNGFSYSNYQQSDNTINNSNRYFGRRRRNSSESSTGSLSNNNNNTNKTNKIPSLLSTPILKPVISSSTTVIGTSSSTTNRVLRESTQNKQATNSRGGGYVMEPLILKKPNIDVAEILKKNQVKSILPLKIIKN